MEKLGEDMFKPLAINLGAEFSIMVEESDRSVIGWVGSVSFFVEQGDGGSALEFCHPALVEAVGVQKPKNRGPSVGEQLVVFDGDAIWTWGFAFGRAFDSPVKVVGREGCVQMASISGVESARGVV